MENLEYFYNNPPLINKFIDRKLKITGGRVLISGALNSGKTYILISELLKFKKDEFLYINMDDLRVKKENGLLDLKEFIKEHKDIKCIAIDNVDDKNLNILKNLNCEKILLSTTSNSLNLKTFQTIKLLNLDFEEYIAFNKRTNELGAILGSFLTEGNGAKNSFLNPFELIIYMQKILKAKYSDIEISVLKECVEFVNLNFSALQIYKGLKDIMKISKDSVYKTIDKFEDENLIFFVPKFAPNSNLKRLYFLDFCLPDNLSFKKDFQKKLTNALLCELLRLDKQVYFTDDLDFYMPELGYGFLVIPFTSSDLIFLKFKKIFEKLKELEVQKLYVISMANSGEMSKEGIKCEILPFWQFALGM
ncbi:ATP-binding protein (AAA domain) [Campylobacter blaseri]|uniref:AAA family ATPase n=1 Tax=Campylobacter blaseri TaxID=2042961 RepID=A0A2P8R3S5_9BACT|nr:ATP-binding protein [Campylobacter blaseri]PSM53154.1 hypothetical protein CQ405_01000 [Campylobacter blaseri]PSM54620.1 hypothetical protein CRN67_01000 [Campylobacter blaseri]QKF86903.1 ATP-binding protein (AAA domain) [Campylobacter blaseri]